MRALTRGPYGAIGSAERIKIHVLFPEAYKMAAQPVEYINTAGVEIYIEYWNKYHLRICLYEYLTRQPVFFV